VANRVRITKRLQELFIAELRKHANVSRASAVISRTRGAMYWLKERRPEFAAVWDEAVESFTDGVESELLRRAVAGVKKPVYYKGEIVGEINEYSDRLLEFWLERRRYPSKQRLEHTGKDGGAIILQAEPHDDTL
jgi:hypothetical protein